MLGFTWAVAVAAEPASPDWVAQAEDGARALIRSCRIRCPLQPSDLAQAFVVTAVAAALRGERDAQAVANALQLDPGAVERWHLMLPTPEGPAEPWVIAWSENRDPPPAKVIPRERWNLDTVLRIDGGLTPDLSGGSLGVELRGSVGFVGVRVESRYTRSVVVRRDLPDISFPDQEARMSMSVGPRWAPNEYTEGFVFAGVEVGTTGARGELVRVLDGIEIISSPASYHVAPRVGAIGLMPLVTTGRMWLRLEATGTYRRPVFFQDYLNPSRQEAAEVENFRAMFVRPPGVLEGSGSAQLVFRLGERHQFANGYEFQLRRSVGAQSEPWVTPTGQIRASFGWRW